MTHAAFENAMAPARKLLAKAALQTTEIRLTGNNPGDQIAAHAKKNKLDVLVMGSHGIGAFRSAVLGSVATRAWQLSVATHCCSSGRDESSPS